MRTPARPRLPDGDCVFISDVRIVARAVIEGAPRDLERGCGLSWIEKLGISDARGFHFGVRHEEGVLLFEVLDLLLSRGVKLSQLLSPRPTKRHMVLPGGTWLESAPTTGCNWSGGTTEPEPSSGSREIWEQNSQI